MFLFNGRKATLYILVAAFTVTFIGAIFTVFYTYNPKLGDSSRSFWSHKNIIFPKSFQPAKLKEALSTFYNIYLQDEGMEDVDSNHVVSYKGEGSSLTPAMIDKEYYTNDIDMFDVKHVGDCQKDMKKLRIGVARTIYLDESTAEMTHKFMHQMEHDEAFHEFKERLYDDVKQFKEDGLLATKWFKFSGSSVWLKEYGVHMMVSRVVYSSVGKRTDPDISFMYAQLFNAQWEELKDSELVLPIVNEHGHADYEAVQFPRFLPVPFYFNKEKRYLGPEDPRMLLYKGKYGEEPIIICNSERRKVESDEDIDSKESKIKYDFQRTMFVVYPFRKQRGKFNVIGSTQQFDNILYLKVTALSRDSIEGNGMEKNWTPMLSHQDLEENGYHKNIYFIYKWQDLAVLKCRMSEEHQGKAPCEFVYTRNDGGGIGPLRGGTEMINLRDLSPRFLNMRSDKEVWVGFARAHIDDCGCGKDMYRPNFAVVTREGDNFKISQLSSYLGLDVWVEGWDDPNVLCVPGEHNALIPNGVSDWVFDGRDDYVTLSLSIADRTNVLVQIRNLFKAVVKRTSVFRFDKDGGLDNRIADCALELSEQFCRAYGSEMEKQGKTPPKSD